MNVWAHAGVQVPMEVREGIGSEEKLQVVVGNHAGAGNQTPDLCKRSKCSLMDEPSPQAQLSPSQSSTLIAASLSLQVGATVE